MLKFIGLNFFWLLYIIFFWYGAFFTSGHVVFGILSRPQTGSSWIILKDNNINWNWTIATRHCYFIFYTICVDLHSQKNVKSTFSIPWYISVVQTSLEVRLWCAMDHIAHTIGNEVGMQFTHLLMFVELEVSAVAKELAGQLTPA